MTIISFIIKFVTGIISASMDFVLKRKILYTCILHPFLSWIFIMQMNSVFNELLGSGVNKDEYDPVPTPKAVYSLKKSRIVK